MLGWLKGIGKALGLITELIRDWRRKRDAKQAQKEFDRIESDPVPSFRRMFERDDADQAPKTGSRRDQ